MKKFYLIFNVMLIFLITTIGRVKAYEEPVGYFYGKEYPIIYNDPDVMPLYEVNGYEVAAFYYSSGGWKSFNQNTTLPSTSLRDFRYSIKLPEPIEKYGNFDVSLSTTFTGNLTGKNQSMYGTDGYGGSTSARTYDITVTQTATDNYTIKGSDLVAESGQVSYIQVQFQGNPSSVNFGMVLTSITVSGVSTDGLIASIASVLAELVPFITNIDKNISSILISLNNGISSIVGAINNASSSIVGAINSMSGSLVSAINSMSNAIQNDLNTINTSINSMNTNIGTKIDTMKETLNSSIVLMKNTLNDTLYTLLGENSSSQSAVTVNDAVNSDFYNASSSYEHIENSAVEDFKNNLANVDTNTDLLNVADFKSTSNFIATNLTNIFNSHDYIGNMIIFSLVIGFSLTLIGIKVRR